MIHLYGIPNCDTIKKARAWLAQRGVDYQFHDFKKEGLRPEQLRDWVDELGWETLLNRRGMMWRKTAQEIKDRIDEASAIQLMLETPGIIKRPVLDLGERRVVGFKESEYEAIFG
jgi:Spx/MgsR family transcriptional regulator